MRSGATVVVASPGQSDRGKRSWTGVALICATLALAAAPVPAQRGDSSSGRRTSTSTGALARGSHPLKAAQLLEYRPVGADARVRFEWDQVSGAREYRLVGSWTGPVAWTVKTGDYAVTARTATSWTPQHVTLEVLLALGNHSWRLFALFGPNDLRAVGDSTPLSFAVK